MILFQVGCCAPSHFKLRSLLGSLGSTSLSSGSHSDSTPLIIASAMLRYEHSRKLVPQVPASLWYGSSTLACTEDAYVYIRRKTHVAIVSSALVFVNMLFFLCRHSDVRYSYGAVRYIPEPGHTEYSFRLLTYIHH